MTKHSKKGEKKQETVENNNNFIDSQPEVQTKDNAPVPGNAEGEQQPIANTDPISEEQALQLVRSKEEERKVAIELRSRILLGYEDIEKSQALEVYSHFKKVDINDIKNIHKKL